ncbi:MAG: YCF48-related protein [Patescibacteria group bacterium]
MMNQISFFSKTLVALVAFVALPVLASATWVEQDHGTMQSVRGIVKAGETLIAVGNSGNMMTSGDDGATWTLSDKISNAWWLDAVLESDGDVVAVGESGTYAVSGNDGSSWSSLSLGMTVNLYGIDRSNSYGYIVGNGGTVLYYSSGLNGWYTSGTNVTDALYAVQDNGDGTAWIVGAAGRLLKATNGGLSFANLGRVAEDNLRGVYFESATTGWIVGENGTLKKTTNSGSNWSTVSVSGLSAQDLYDIQVFGESMVVVGDKIILMSEDGGDTWSAQDFTDENITFYGAYYGSASELWAAGTDFDVWSSVYYFDVAEEETSDLSVPSDPQITEAEPNNLIKLTCEGETAATDPCRAVYFYGTDEKRHAFPNEKVFFTWYVDFDDVIEVSADFLSDLSLGGNVTYHPGTRMVKFQSVPTVYAVEALGVLRAIASEDIASGLYGANWNQQIDDISDAFLGNYHFGEDIDSADDYDVEAEEESVVQLDDNF